MIIKFVTLMISLFLFAGTAHYESMKCESKHPEERANNSNKQANKAAVSFSSFPPEMMPFAPALLF